ncbi:MAG TPA: tRNA (N6-isopentenyl adenosine(37)-C2)-methylthiotransferase MiaB [Oscillospiraceae bacterium]|nr:tRNA (N6-isopentenyl adenosine(37)-C2)-methylthiotransferase MiaB [Oscillospiraceae bacterium]HPS35029.1 tRNA (N6-isopentenyl adenosine(37)-C2)-methylthiotransferase MiaB [Oscillospiraceae bacterium]
MSEAGVFHVGGDEISAQRRFMALLKSRNDAFFVETGLRRLAFVHSYGCQQNAVDGERISGMLAECGYVFTDDPKAADLVVYNTCAVRENAEDRVFGNTGALLASKRKNPDKIICLCGCMIQQPESAEKIKKHFPYVDMLVGTHAVHKFPQLLFEKLQNGGHVFETPGGDGVIAEELPVMRSDSIYAGVSVMYGCNNFCTYCVVPNVRGRERSREPGAILSEVGGLVRGGWKDITLLGQNVNSYGKNDNNKPDFPELFKQCCTFQGDYWVRFMTSHPKDADEALFEVIASEQHAAKHLHLPVQSGSDEILRRMNRRYDAGAYLKKLGAMRKLYPDIALTSDIIVGFPGETENDFQKTLELVEAVRYDSLYMFIYSPRPNTPAAGYENQIPQEEKVERFERLLALQDKIAEQKHKALVGKTLRVLTEQFEQKHKMWSGKDSGVTRVLFAGEENENLRGQFIETEIVSAGRHWVTGRRI